MSQTPILTARQMFQSHTVSCKICKGYYGVKDENTKKKIAKYKLCPVGALLYQRAKTEDPNASPSKPQSFPFVAKLYERVLARIGNEWIEARVIDRSVSAAMPYEKLNEDTGLLEWRTSTPQIVGYEVEVRGTKHYVNRYNIKKLKPDTAHVHPYVLLPPRKVMIKHG